MDTTTTSAHQNPQVPSIHPLYQTQQTHQLYHIPPPPPHTHTPFPPKKPPKSPTTKAIVPVTKYQTNSKLYAHADTQHSTQHTAHRRKNPKHSAETSSLPTYLPTYIPTYFIFNYLSRTSLVRSEPVRGGMERGCEGGGFFLFLGWVGFGWVGRKKERG